jgi:hypothetical protein
MARRVAEVVYKLRDVFTGPAAKVRGAYDKIRRSSRKTADSVSKDNSRIERSFGRLRGVIAGFATALTFRGAVRTINETADELDRLGKAARKLELDPQSLAGLEFAAERSGVAIGKVEKSLFTLQKRSGEAAKGLGAAKFAFEALNIDAEKFNELEIETQIKVLADRLKDLPVEERGALASAFFGKQNAQEFLNLLNQGSGSISALIDQFNELNTITTESTQAAEDYKDALTNINAAIDGIKNQRLPPILRDITDVLDYYGARGEEAELNRELTILEKRLSFIRADSLEAREIEKRVDIIRESLRGLAEDASSVDDEPIEIDISIDDSDVRAQYQRTVDSLTDIAEDGLKERTQLLNAETAEVRQAQAEQLRIARQFRQLREDLDRKPAEDVTGLDVQVATLEARRQLDQGNADAAIEAAGKAGELLRDLSENGEQSGFVLRFLAKQIEDIANAAAQQNVDAELIDQEKAQASVDAFKGKLEALKGDAVKQGAEAGKAFVEAFKAELDVATLTLPSVSPSSGGRQFRDAIEREGST